MLKRVRKEDVRQIATQESNPLDVCLDCWKNWMAGDGDKDLGAKTMRLLTGDSDGHGVDSSEAQQARDNEIGAATDAMIDSLSHLHRWAIYKLCSVSTPWSFPRADIFYVGPAAREALAEKLKRNVGTRMLF